MTDTQTAPPIGSERQHFSINQQIEEVRREIGYREKVYPFLISRGKLRQSIATYQLDRMRAVLRTLQWLAEHEIEIKGRVGGHH
jgi:hypothetical protein